MSRRKIGDWSMPGDNFFWDSCVFSAYLRDETHAYDIDSITQFLQEARSGDITIYTSTMSLVEILPSHMKKAESFEEFVEDYQGAVVLVDPSPVVMTLAGRLRDLPYRKGKSLNRRLSASDAIMLATALHLERDYGTRLTAFHTFDGGGKKDIEGSRAIPLLGYESWCEGFDAAQSALVEPLMQMNRCKPVHPKPRLPHVA